jgi:hypothetical protein
MVRKRKTTEERMIAKLLPHFRPLFPGEELSIKLFPVHGYWRQIKADVQQFTGRVQVGSNVNHTYDIGSWESMTDCLRFGFKFHDCRKHHRPYAKFEIEALDRTVKR